MRYLTTVQFGLRRVAKEDLEIAGAQIKKGDLVVVVMNAANRDLRAFDNPDAMDIDRKIVRHLGFGYGVHAASARTSPAPNGRPSCPSSSSASPTCAWPPPRKKCPWTSPAPTTASASS
ncbi:cytochrome P450 [Nonomuraea sp. NBC_00507]|uniref:cytochrome P450 n=1 Tax=Nonomuraea sp. NBC_00507 TaxID=2976002 RepID=UPI003FA5E588